MAPLPRLESVYQLYVKIVGADLVEPYPGSPVIPDFDFYDPFWGVCNFN